MAIRKQDKAIIHYIALLGAVLSALASGFYVWTLPEQQQIHRVQKNERLAEVGAINKLKEACILTDQISLPETVADDLNLINTNPDNSEIFTEDWSTWKIALFSIAGGVAAGTACYGLLWSSMYLGAMLLYALIRKIYQKIPEHIKYDISNIHIDDKGVTDRNPNRILPVIIKIVSLLSLALIMLGIIVWQLTNRDF